MKDKPSNIPFDDAEAPSLDDFSRERRWVAWVDENGRKVPKSPKTGRNADCINSPQDWGTRAEAEQRARRIGGGVGFILGGIGVGLNVSGIDLDGCLDESGAVTDKAREVIERFNTYAEKSPSGYGVKLFFLARTADLAAVCPSKRRSFSGVGEHREIALDIQRYYTVTGEKLRGSSTKLRHISRADLEWLVHDFGPRFGGNRGAAHRAPIDNTGSGYGRRFFKERSAQGDDYDMARAAIVSDPGRAGDWARKSTTDERQLRRAWEARVGGEKDVITKKGYLDSVLASNVVMKAIRWFWPGRFAYGKLGMIVGDPEQGKSQLALYMIARATRGRQWHDGGRAPLCNCIIMSAEDDIDDTLAPRLAAAGANLKKVKIIKMKKVEGQEYMFSLVEDMNLLEREIDNMGDVDLVVFDPVTAYMGVKKIDSYRTTDVRGVLAPLAAMAARKGIVILLVTHFNKNTLASAINRITDSHAFGATVRHCYAAIEEEGGERQLFLRVKNNLARKNEQKRGLAYTFAEKVVGTDNKKDIVASYVVWDAEPVDMTANEALAALRHAGGRPDNAREAAKNLIEDMLGDGQEIEAHKMEQMAEARNISRRTLHRAADDKGVVKSGAKGRDEKSTWKLPNDE